MRKKRNFINGGYTGNPYQLAMQQAMAAANQYSTTDPNRLALDNTDIMGMAGGAGQLQLNPNQSTAIGAGSTFNNGIPKKKSFGIDIDKMTENIGLAATNPYAAAAKYGIEMIGDFVDAADYKAELGPEKSQKDYNKEILMSGLTKGPIGMIPSIIRMNKDKNTIVSGSPGTYATGGMMDEDGNPNDADDRQLSNSAFQVKDDPNVTDGKYYPGYNANLDHNEVVDKNAKFVFSNELKNGKETFAKEASEIYKRIGKVENRTDDISKATVAQLNKQIQTLAMTQEQLASALGLRNTKPQGMAAGGSLSEGPGDRYYVGQGIGGQKMYYDYMEDAYYTTNPMNPSSGLERMSSQSELKAIYGITPRPDGYIPPALTSATTPTTIPPTVPSATQTTIPTAGSKAASAKKTTGATLTPEQAAALGLKMSTETGKYIPATPLSINNNAKGISIPAGGTQYISADLTIPNWARAVSTPTPQNKPVYMDTPEGQVDISGLDGALDPTPTETITDRESRIVTPDGKRIVRGLDPMIDSTKPAMTMSPVIDQTSLLDSLRKTTTVGDVMQGIEVGSKFFGLGRGPERERPIYNAMPITKSGYDVNPALYQNQRNFQNTVNSIGTSSAPQRKAMINSLLGTKLNADSQVLTNYQNMNNQANTQYEERLGQRRAQNMASQFQTNNLNAANRGQYDNAVQNAFTSVGNFGEALNKQKQSYDVLDLLQLNYPQVYKGVMSDWEEIKNGKKKKTTTETTTTTTNGN